MNILSKITFYKHLSRFFFIFKQTYSNKLLMNNQNILIPINYCEIDFLIKL